jgi:hypothetical protein
MAKFVILNEPQSATSFFVNPDKVRFLRAAGNDATAIIFDQEHVIHVRGTPDAVSKAFSQPEALQPGTYRRLRKGTKLRVKKA